MGDKFVLVTITVNVPEPEKSYYLRGGFQWRLYGQAEPLTVSLDLRDDFVLNGGVLKEIRFFISESVVQGSDRFHYHQKPKGLPLISFDEKEAQHGYYHEEKGNFSFHLVDNSLYCLFDNMESTSVVEVNEQLSCIFDNQNALSGLKLQNLSTEEIIVFKEANLL